MIRTRTWLVAPVLLLGLTAGCSGSSSDDSATRDPSPTATSSAGATPTDSPVVIKSYPGFSSCQIHQGAFLVAAPLQVSRAASLGEAEIVGGTNVTLGDATIAPAPSGTPDDGFAIPGDQPGPKIAKQLGWADRQPLDGAEVDPGAYFVFLPMDVAGDGSHFDGYTVQWTEGDQGGITSAESVTDFKDKC